MCIRDRGYGLHNDIAATIAKRGCDLVIVVDCGSQDVEAVETLKKSGIPVIVLSLIHI